MKTTKRIADRIANARKNDTDDYGNPDCMFQTFNDDMLLAIALGLVDAVEIAKDQLAGRGLNADGEWVGFKNAEKIWEAK